MSRLTLAATALALAAGALGGAAYQKAVLVQTQVRALRAAPSDPGEGRSIEALEHEVGVLTTRVALLELRARSAALPPVEASAAPPAEAPAAPPAEETERPSRSPYDLGPLPKDAAQRQERKKMVGSTVAAHWKAWGATHGLTERQAADLASLQADAAGRRLDNQARLADGTTTLPELRASNQASADDVRRKAQGVLTPEQFAQFEAEKGADWGASYRKVREAEAKEAAPALGPRN